jgi:hypothetical protein
VPGVKWPGGEADHSPSVKSGWNYNSTPPILLHGDDRKNSHDLHEDISMHNRCMAGFRQMDFFRHQHKSNSLEGSMFLRNVGTKALKYTAQRPRIPT